MDFAQRGDNTWPIPRGATFQPTASADGSGMGDTDDTKSIASDIGTILKSCSVAS